MKKTSLSYCFAITLAATALVTSHAFGANANSSSKGEIARAQNPIPGQYIVVLKEASGQNAFAAGVQSLMSKFRSQTRMTFDAALTGFSVEVSEEMAKEIAAHPAVDFVEENGVVRLATVQSSAPWGLDRIDQSALPLNSAYSYVYNGSGVHAYVVDTGIRTTHQEFEGRATRDYDAFGGSASDDQGHGTHVAATIGGRYAGVAKKVNLHSVKVLDSNGSGSVEGIVAAMNWISRNRRNPAIVNMSIGGGASASLDLAVRNAIRSGITVVVAAGNENTDASYGSPARVTEAITVGATTSQDYRAGFSNYGSVVDIFAPGQDIYSASIQSNSGYVTMSGTSMASPHVAGVAALILQATPQLSPSQVQRTLIGNSKTNVVYSAGRNSPNRLLQTNVTPVWFQ